MCKERQGSPRPHQAKQSLLHLTAPLGCNRKKVHGALDMCTDGKGAEFLLFFFFTGMF